MNECKGSMQLVIADAEQTKQGFFTVECPFCHHPVQVVVTMLGSRLVRHDTQGHTLAAGYNA